MKEFFDKIMKSIRKIIVTVFKELTKTINLQF
jgi:hypothetical protein